MAILDRMNATRRIDLHMHTMFSDGNLLPSELLRHAAMKGHKAVAVTDHADSSNLESLLAQMRAFLADQGEDFGPTLLIGVELTHVAPGSIARLAERAKTFGADLVVVHGETIVEPVAPGTNRAAVECPFVDLLAHPGFLSEEEARLAEGRGCLIEITARKGHSLTNGHVARICRSAGALIVINTDTHGPDDLITFERAQQIAAGAGLTESEIAQAVETAPNAFVERCLAARVTLGF
ncbi:MAG: histidinol phosphate phosphatase domain-containing protein [Anaerolineae bacterium]